jgi:SAM-dependent methyltransferase
VLDLGCGLGHDLVRLEGVGLTAIGLDTSEVMLQQAHKATAGALRLAKADGANLPFPDGSFDGCRIERVLQHVADPDDVVAEVRRVLRQPGGFVTVLEPDYTTFRVVSDVDPDGDLVARHLRVRHPDIGGRLVPLAEAHGFVVDDLVCERSFGHRYTSFPVDVATVLGRVDDQELVARWVEEQHAREALGTLRIELTKVLVVAHLP